MGDRRGRRAVLMLVILLMAGATSVVAFLLGYAAIGLLAPIVLVLLRAVQGLAAGGELGVAAVFLLEHAPDSRRGRTGAWHTATMGIGIGVGMAVMGVSATCSLVRATTRGPAADRLLDRHPPRTGLLLRRRLHRQRALPGSAGWIRGFRSTRSGTSWISYRISLVRGFCLLAAGSLAFNTFFIFMPNNLIARHRVELTPTLLVTALSLGFAALAAVGLGRLAFPIGSGGDPW